MDPKFATQSGVQILSIQTTQILTVIVEFCGPKMVFKS